MTVRVSEMNRNDTLIKINQLYKDEEYEKAIPYLLNLDTLYKKETYPMYLLGRAYYHLDSLEKAKKYLTKLSFIDKEDFKILRSRKKKKPTKKKGAKNGR